MRFHLGLANAITVCVCVLPMWVPAVHWWKDMCTKAVISCMLNACTLKR